MMWWIAILAACSSPEPSETQTDAAGTDDSGELVLDTAPPPTMTGTAPTNPKPVPEFVATNFDGGTRGQGDLIGSPTVMWFYPKAATAG